MQKRKKKIENTIFFLDTPIVVTLKCGDIKNCCEEDKRLTSQQWRPIQTKGLKIAGLKKCCGFSYH